MTKDQLEQILAYQNENVLSRFTDLFNVSESEAIDLFADTRKFLYLSQLPNIFIPDELLMIDEMWHNFILFTRDYHEFCNRFFGRYFHHLPATKAEKEGQKALQQQSPAEAERQFNSRLQYLISNAYDHLGEATVIKWFKIYPVQYSKTSITQLRKY